MLELTKREFSGRYRGSFGGVLWALVQPLFMLAVYTVAFGVILQARWAATGDTTDYALMLFAGLIVFNAFSECLNQTTGLITSNPNFVKKVVFPLELLPVITVITALAHALIGIAVWFIGHLLLKGLPPVSALFFPLVLAAFAPLLIGLGWLLSAVGVIVRDIAQLTGVVSHTLLFLTPIFYSIDTAPVFLQQLLALNPLTFVVEQFRNVIFHGYLPDWSALALYAVLSSLFAWSCLAVFRRLRPVFADLV